MPFAPHEIENKRFVVGLRGYQTDEVDSFLRSVAADYKSALARADAAEKVARVAAALPQQQPQADLSQRLITAAHERAEAEAAAIVSAAQRDAAAIREAANAEAEAVFAEVARQTAELRRMEAEVLDRLLALDRAVREGQQALGRGLSPVR